MKQEKLDVEAIMKEFIAARGPAERETIIRRADDERTWTITTDSPAMIAKLVNRGYRPTRPTPGGQLWFEVPKTKVSLRSPAPTGAEDDGEEIVPIKRRQVSEEQARALADRMRQAREARRAPGPSAEQRPAPLL